MPIDCCTQNDPSCHHNVSQKLQIGVPVCSYYHTSKLFSISVLVIYTSISMFYFVHLSVFVCLFVFCLFVYFCDGYIPLLPSDGQCACTHDRHPITRLLVSDMGVFSLNTLRPRQAGHYFPDDIFKCIFFNENVWIWITISLNLILGV